MSWPAMAYVYGTWAYAFQQALSRASVSGRKMYLYQGTLMNRVVWIVAWDPKE